MTDERHDQNKGLETPDTAPSRGRVFGLAIIMYALVACIGYIFIYQLGAAVELGGGESFESTPFNSVEGRSFERAIYLAPPENRLLIPEQIEFANLEVVTNQIELATALGNFPEIQIVFIDPEKVSADEITFLRQFYEGGKTLIALNTPHSTFSQALGVEPAVQDLEPEEVRRSLLTISLHRLGGDEPQELAASFNQFAQMLTITHGLAR